MALGHVEGGGIGVEHTAHGVGVGPHGEQHPADIRVVHNQRLLPCRGTHCTALTALQGERRGVLECPLGDGQTFDSDA